MAEYTANQAVTQQSLARLAGLIFIVAMATRLFAEFYVHFPSRLIADGDIAQTVKNLARDGKLYNVGRFINPAGFAPIVIDEIALGLWLLARGVRTSEAGPWNKPP